MFNLDKLEVIDLTHTLQPDIPHWLIDCGFQHEIVSDYDTTSNGTMFRGKKLTMHAGTGTHIDAPVHCIPGAADIASLSLKQLIRPCVVIDVSEKAHENYVVTEQDILSFENAYGEIAANNFVIIHTGWGKYWHNVSAYRNDLQFPTISKQVAALLLQRDIAGLGIDTLSPDNEKQGFPVHQLLLSAAKYIIENIAHADLLPARGAWSFALPLKLATGTESPIRLIALVEQSRLHAKHSSI